MSKCDLPNTDPLLNPGTCSLDANGKPIVTTTPAVKGDCVTSADGIVTNNIPICTPWDLTQGPENALISAYIQQQLAISGAIVNVYKLLGVHEQGKLQDLTGNGVAISNGFIPNYPASNAFDKFITEWRSNQLGANVTKLAYLGYDFGEIKLENGRNRYGIETFVRKDVSTIKIKQGCDSINRATKIRVERSDDGQKWYGVSVLDVPDCDGLVTLAFNKSVPSRYWRVRPVKFNGGTNDWWSVQALQLIDYEFTDITNIQDRIFLENRDRDYDEFPVRIKGSYTPPDLQSFQSKYGMSQLFGGSEQYIIEVSFAQVVQSLGRPFVIGDIIQLPSETQYTPALKPILKYLEITNVAWSTNGYTPGWVPTMQKITGEPVIASQETQDLFGKLTPDLDETGLMDINDGQNNKPYQDLSAFDQTVKADANTAVPVRGEDFADMTKLSKEAYEWAEQYPNVNLKKIDRVRNVYGVDAMPPNGLPYTEGDEFPTTPKNNDYHRLTYTHIKQGIPARLYRYSQVKTRWIYLETDMRAANKNAKPILQEFLDPATSTVTHPEDINTDLKK